MLYCRVCTIHITINDSKCSHWKPCRHIMLCALFKLWNTQRTHIYISASRVSTSPKNIHTLGYIWKSMHTSSFNQFIIEIKSRKKLNVSRTSSLPNLDGFTEVLAHVPVCSRQEFVLGLFTRWKPTVYYVSYPTKWSVIRNSDIRTVFRRLSKPIIFLSFTLRSVYCTSWMDISHRL